MASPTLVQASYTGFTPAPPGTASITFPNNGGIAQPTLVNITKGNLLLVVAEDVNTLGTPAISDTMGNNWILIQSGTYQFSGVNKSVAVWYAVAKSTGGDTITVGSSSTDIFFRVAEFSPAVVDVYSIFLPGTGDHVFGALTTEPSADRLFIGWVINSGTANSPFTLIADGGNNPNVGLETATSVGAYGGGSLYASDFTQAGSQGWATGLVVLRSPNVPVLLSSDDTEGNRAATLTISPSVTSVGDLLLAFVFKFDTVAITVSDNFGNIWNLLQSATFNGGAYKAWVFYSFVTVPGTPNVQVNVVPNATTDFTLTHYSPCAIDVFSPIASGIGAGTVQSAAITPNFANELLVGWCDSHVPPAGLTAGSPFALDNAGQRNTAMGTESDAVASLGSYTSKFTVIDQGGNNSWATGLIALYDPSQNGTWFKFSFTQSFDLSK